MHTFREDAFMHLHIHIKIYRLEINNNKALGDTAWHRNNSSEKGQNMCTDNEC
jgi:hypothetical protein